MKKFITLVFVFLFINGSAFASGVGYINYEKVIANYQFAKTTLSEIENKSREIEIFLQTKEKAFDKIESAVQKKKFENDVRAELKTREKAFNQFREKKEEEVYKRIHNVSEKIRIEKGYDAILDQRSVFSGGIDITDLLIQRLNSVEL